MGTNNASIDKIFKIIDVLINNVIARNIKYRFNELTRVVFNNTY